MRGDSQQLLDVAGERRLSTSKRRRAEHAVTQSASSRHGAEARQLNDRCRDSVWSSMHVLRLLLLVGFLGELLGLRQQTKLRRVQKFASQGGDTTQVGQLKQLTQASHFAMPL